MSLKILCDGKIENSHKVCKMVFFLFVYVFCQVKICFLQAYNKRHLHCRSETSERYMLKLFREFVFHQVDSYGAPIVDLAHIVLNLNKVRSTQNLKKRRDTFLLVVFSWMRALMRRCSWRVETTKMCCLLRTKICAAIWSRRFASSFKNDCAATNK